MMARRRKAARDDDASFRDLIREIHKRGMVVPLPGPASNPVGLRGNTLVPTITRLARSIAVMTSTLTADPVNGS